MDVHRCRFVPYPPSAINAFAFSHTSSLTSSSKGPSTLRLAIGRANGDIEIWNPLRGAWHQETIFRGGKDRSIEGLVWTQDPGEKDKNGYMLPGQLRLFSTGYSGSVTEWDLSTGKPARHASGNYGELWCMAAQPRVSASDKTLANGANGEAQEELQYQSLAVGCADGSIVLMSTADGDLKFQRTLTRPPKKNARVLSITWQSRHTVVTGHADSTIRVFDARNGQQIRSMSLGAGPQGGPKEILVWSVKSMVDGTIISGDSTGTVSFWDAKHYSRLQRISSHKEDILDLAVSIDGESVFSGGLDRRTTLYRQSAGSRPGEKKRWMEVAHQRFHSHDIKAMATFETKNFSILVSGGLDTTPIIVPIREFGREHHRILSSLPQQPVVRSAPRKNLLVSWWDREVSIWAVSRAMGIQSDETSQAPSRKLVAKVLLQGDESILSADITADGSLLAVSTLSEIRVFRLKEKIDSTISLRKTNLPNGYALAGAKIVQFSPDGKWLLFVACTNKIQLLRITLAHTKTAFEFLSPSVELKRLPRKAAKAKYMHGSLAEYDRSACRVAFSADSRILVTGDLSGNLDTFVLEGHEDLSQEPPVTKEKDHDDTSSSSSSLSSDDDSEPEDNPTLIYAQHWRRSPTAHLVPTLPSRPLIMSFRPSSSPLALTNGTSLPHPTRHNPYPHSHDLPSGEDRLLILTALHQMYEINVLAGQISDWSRRNPTSALPKEFRHLRDRGMGCVWDVASPSPSSPKRERIWLYGSGWLWMFDLGQNLPIAENSESEQENGKALEGWGMRKHKKRKRGREGEKMKMIEQDGYMNGEIKHRKERDTGAGSKVAVEELHTGIGRKMRKVEGEKTAFIHLDNKDHRHGNPDSDDENGDDDAAPEQGSSKALMSLRRGEETAVQQQTESPAYWATYKYRPILGIVPIRGQVEDGDAVAGKNGAGVEVALVERPMFEVDLPGRYYGDQEWKEKKEADVDMGR